MPRQKTGRQLINNLKYNNGLYLRKDLEAIIHQLPHLRKIFVRLLHCLRILNWI